MDDSNKLRKDLQQFEEDRRAGRMRTFEDGTPVTRADIYEYHGAIEAAIDEWEKELPAVRESQDRYRLIDHLLKLGSHLVKSHRTELGETLLQEGLRLAAAASDPRRQAQAHLELAVATLALRRPQEVVEHCKQVLMIARSIGDRHFEHLGLANLGGILCELGERDQGINFIMHARKIANETGEKAREAQYCVSLGDRLLQIPLPNECLEAYEHAQALYGELGVGPDARVAKIIKEVRAVMNRD